MTVATHPAAINLGGPSRVRRRRIDGLRSGSTGLFVVLFPGWPEDGRGTASGRHGSSCGRSLGDGGGQRRERRRADAAAAEIVRQQEARERDEAHRRSINRAALEAFVAGGMTEECAKQAITLIAQRKIPNIAISY